VHSLGDRIVQDHPRVEEGPFRLLIEQPGSQRLREEDVGDLRDDRARTGLTIVRFRVQRGEDGLEPRHCTGVVRHVQHVREERERRVGDSLGEREPAAEQPRQ
jgi:hypothetical protein